MEYKLELKPFVQKDGVKYKILQITDIALHTAKMPPTTNVGRKIQQSLAKNKPGRIYSPIQQPPDVGNDRMSFILDLIKQDPKLVKMVQEEEENGYKILISIPKEGVPVVAGKDTQEFIKSKNGQRVLRGLAKNKSKE